MEKDFDIYRHRTRIYLIMYAVVSLLVFSIPFLPMTFATLFSPAWRSGLAFVFIWFIGLSICIGFILLCPLWIYALHYRLESRTLRVDKGFIFRSRKSIPLEKITDVELVQGPLLWVLGMWTLRIQTASTGQQRPEATLIGCIDPEQVRDDILAARDEYMRGLASR